MPTRECTLRAWIWICASAPLLCGCAVPQKPGQGRALHRAEAATGRSYYLYLPNGYVKQQGRRDDGRRWPVVVSFHGMRPFDDYGAHIRQWQGEADRYGFIVCAPRLGSCDVGQPFPIDKETPVVRRDADAVLAILDEIFRLTNADPNHVLATSFSSGGYIAHYMLNRFPERFTCLAVFQSNFSPEILDPRHVPRYRGHPIAILSSENDLSITRRESGEAVAWYNQRGFGVTAQVIAGIGHERTPELVAPLFASTAQVRANTPPATERFRVADATPTWPPEGGAPSVQPPSPRGRPVVPPGGDLGTLVFANPPTASMSGINGSSGNATPNGRPSPGGSVRIIPIGPGARNGRPQPVPAPTIPVPKRTTRTPRRSIPIPEAPAPAENARILVNSQIGVAPHLISFSADIPRDLQDGADYLWMDNNVPFAKRMNGQKMFTEPGEHTLSVLIVTRDNREFRASTRIIILEPLRSR